MTRSINIRVVLNGYLVHIGCQCAVFTTPEALGFAITEYYKDPVATEKKYLEASLCKSSMDVCGIAPTQPYPQGVPANLQRREDTGCLGGTVQNPRH